MEGDAVALYPAVALAKLHQRFVSSSGDMSFLAALMGPYFFSYSSLKSLIAAPPYMAYPAHRMISLIAFMARLGLE